VSLQIDFRPSIRSRNEGSDEFRFDFAFITTPNGQANVEVVTSVVFSERAWTTAVLEDQTGFSGRVSSSTHPTVDDPYFALVIRSVEEDASSTAMRQADVLAFTTALREETNSRLSEGAPPTAAQLRAAGLGVPLEDNAGDDDDLIGVSTFLNTNLGTELYEKGGEITLPTFSFRGDDAVYIMTAIVTPIGVERRRFLSGVMSEGTKPTQDFLVVPYITKNGPGVLTESFQSTTTKENLVKLYFGDPGDSTADSLSSYIREISRGRFTITDRSGVQVLDPARPDVPIIEWPAEVEDHLKAPVIRARVIEAVAALHDFDVYRPAGVARTEQYELTNNDIALGLVAAASRPDGGQVAGSHPGSVVLNDATQLTGRFRPFGIAEGSSLPLIAHEFLHLLGPIDMYGPFAIGWNAASILGNTSSMRHPDAMTKVLLGWAEPREIDIGGLRNNTRTERLLAVSVPATRPEQEPIANPIVVWNSNRGEDEFFVLEYRNSNVGPDGHYDRNLTDWGLAIWHVRSTAGSFKKVPTHITGVDGSRKVDGDDRLQGSGWRRYSILIAAEENIIYGVAPNGMMMYYRHNARATGEGGAQGFEVMGERQVSSDNDWDTFEKIVYAGQGVFYCVRPDGGLTWRRVPFGAELNRGTAEAAQSANVSLGNGWGSFHNIIGGDRGVLYCIKNDGTMVWYRHLGWETGTQQWLSAGEKLVSVQPIWNQFRHVGFGGNGVFICVRADGRVVKFRHISHDTGELNWENSGIEQTILNPGLGGSNWAEYVRFTLSRDEGVMYAQKSNGAFIWHKYFNNQWVSPEGREIQGPQNHYVDWGPDGVLDTVASTGENTELGSPVNLVSAPDGVLASKVGFWKPADGKIPLRWLSQKLVHVELVVSDASINSNELSVSVRLPRV